MFSMPTRVHSLQRRCFLLGYIAPSPTHACQFTCVIRLKTDKLFLLSCIKKSKLDWNVHMHFIAFKLALEKPKRKLSLACQQH